MSMKWNVGTKIGAGFGLALMILGIIGVVSYQGTVKLTDTQELVAHTHLVLEDMVAVMSALKDAETGTRGYLITGEDPYLDPYNQALLSINDKTGAVRTMSHNATNQHLIEILVPLIDTRLQQLKEVIDLRRSKGFDAARTVVVSDKGRKTMDDIRNTISEMEANEKSLLAMRNDEALQTASNAKMTILFGTLSALILLGFAAVTITRNISVPLKGLTAIAERITRGDLNAAVRTSDRSDEVGVLAKTFEQMTQSLRTLASAAGQIAGGDLRSAYKPQSSEDVLGNAFAQMTENLREQTRGMVESAGVLGAAASEIVASTSQLSSSASESATSVSETTTTVEEVRQTAQVASHKAKAVSDSAQKAAQISQNGRKSTEEAAAGMSRIRQQMEAIAASMVRLSEQSQTIGQIIASVEDLATQSNLLAVNAAIEAAKAGEYGKGFSVVAQEVKSLAEQSRQATNQVRTILSDIQKATTAAVMATEQGSKAVEAGVKQTATAGDSIQLLAGSVMEAAQSATQIAASSQQQLVGMDQVAIAMENIKQSSTQNVASAKQLESAARNLKELGQRLKLMVDRYTI